MHHRAGRKPGDLRVAAGFRRLSRRQAGVPGMALRSKGVGTALEPNSGTATPKRQGRGPEFTGRFQCGLDIRCAASVRACATTGSTPATLSRRSSGHMAAIGCPEGLTASTRSLPPSACSQTRTSRHAARSHPIMLIDGHGILSVDREVWKLGTRVMGAGARRGDEPVTRVRDF